jgi:DNA-binding MarR family transcriptional regulator
MKSTQRSIMMQVARFGAPTVSELAAMLVLDRSALAHNLKPLERDGLITLTSDPNDRRTRRVRLTQQGETRLEESRTLWREAQRRFEKAFGAERAGELRDTLTFIASAEFETAFEKANGR